MVTHDLVFHYKDKLFKVDPFVEDEYSLVNLKTDFCKKVLGSTEGVSMSMITLEAMLPPTYEVKTALKVDTDLFSVYGVICFFKDKALHVKVSYDPSNGDSIPVPAPSSPTSAVIGTHTTLDGALEEIFKSPLRYFIRASPANPPPTSEQVLVPSKRLITTDKGKSKMPPKKYPKPKPKSKGSSSNAVKRVTRNRKLNFEDLDENLVENETFVLTDSEDEDWASGEEQGENNDSEDDSEESDTESSGGDSMLSGYEDNEEAGLTFCSDSEDETPLGRFSDSIRGNAFTLNAEGKIELKVNQTFSSIKQFREVLKDFAVQEGFQLHRIKNEKSRVRCECQAPGCPWRIYASPQLDKITYEIRTLQPEHTCVRGKTEKNKECNSTWIAKRYMDLLATAPNLSAADLRALLKADHGVDFKSPRRFYRAKVKVMAFLSGDFAGSYDRLQDYARRIVITNPGSMARISRHPTALVNGNRVFKSFFFSFHAQKMAYLKGCRPFISVDGCHLKGPHGGILLSAVALDANRGILPLAVMIVESETKHTWGEFMRHLWDHIGSEETRLITFMSDRQKGVIDGIKMHFPYSRHRFCALHIYANFKGRWPGAQMRGLYWQCVRATKKSVFDNAMEQIKALDVEAHKYLDKIGAEHWSLHAFDEAVKCDHVTNNMSESFNSSLGAYRQKPVLQLCERVRRLTMKRMHSMYEKAVTADCLVPKEIKKQVENLGKIGRRCTLLVPGRIVFEIGDREKTYVVNLEKKTCDCRYWMISGVPCRHAMCAILHMRDNPYTYYNPYLQVGAYTRTYEFMITPIADESRWDKFERGAIEAPIKYRAAGRPSVRRRRAVDELPSHTANVGRKHGTKKCKKCNQFGHNARTCGGIPKRKQRGKQNQEHTGTSGTSAATTGDGGQSQRGGEGFGNIPTQASQA